MFKKGTVIKFRNYKHAQLMEDDMFWTRMTLARCKSKIVDDCLVFCKNWIKDDFKVRYVSKNINYVEKSLLGLASYWDYFYIILG